MISTACGIKFSLGHGILKDDMRESTTCLYFKSWDTVGVVQIEDQQWVSRKIVQGRVIKLSGK